MNKKNMQLILLVLVAVAIMVASVLTTAYMRGIDLSFLTGGGKKAGFQPPISLGEAIMSCENYTRKQFGTRLRVLTNDHHSTRRDAGEQMNLVFFKAELYASGAASGVTEDYFVSCVTPLDDAEVAQFDYSKDMDFKPKALRKTEGNVFGFK